MCKRSIGQSINRTVGHDLIVDHLISSTKTEGEESSTVVNPDKYGAVHDSTTTAGTYRTWKRNQQKQPKSIPYSRNLEE